MITKGQKEVLTYLNNKIDFEYSDFEPELRGLAEGGYVKLDDADDTIYLAELTSKGALLVKNAFSEELLQNQTSSNTINGNNNNIILSSTISNSFNTEQLNNFIQEIMESDTSEEVKLYIEKWNSNHQELFKELIEIIKSLQGKNSKLDALKNFAIKISEKLTTSLLDKILTAILMHL